MASISSIVKTLSIKRILNITQSVLNYLLLKLRIGFIVINKPLTITIELSSTCNLSCPECPVGMGKVKRINRFMDFEMAKKIIDLHFKNAVVAILYFQGEPFLNPQWFEIITYAHEKRLFTILSTNAQTLNKQECEKIIGSGLDQIIISADGAEQAVYEKYRIGGDFSKIIATLNFLSSLKKTKKTNTPQIIYQTLLSKYTEHQIQTIKHMALIWGADKVDFKTMQIYNQSAENLSKWLPETKAFQRLNNKKRSRIVCWRALTNAVYTTDGMLVPCCFDKLSEFSFETVFNNAWESKKRKMFLINLSCGRISPHICRNCTQN